MRVAAWITRKKLSRQDCVDVELRRENVAGYEPELIVSVQDSFKKLLIFKSIM